MAAHEARRRQALTGSVGLLDDESHVSAIYTKGFDGAYWRDAGTAAAATGAPVIGNNAALAAQTLQNNAVAGTYDVYLRGSGSTQIRIDSSGAIAPVGSGCRLQGQLDPAPLAQLLKLSVFASDCAGLSGAWRGFLVRDADDAPAAFRLVSADGGTLKDAWAYAK